MSDSVLITGAAGFIGSHLARTLVRAGRRVVGIDNLDPFYPAEWKLRNVADLTPDRFTLVRADITAPGLDAIVAAHRPAIVFHLA